MDKKINELKKRFSEIELGFIKRGKNNSYLLSYPHFIKYFKNIPNNEIKEEHFIISSHFVYGWMPRILHLKHRDFSLILGLLNKAKTDEDLSIEELKTLKSNINNSMVGVSKLLHFINPSKYAIWDSNVYKFFNGISNYNEISKPENYFFYNRFLKEQSKSPDVKKIRKRLEKIIDYEISDLRALELVIFLDQKKSIKSPHTISL